MGKKTIIQIAAIFILALGSVFILIASTSKKQSACKETMQDCCQKKQAKPIENNILFEPFSKQFIFIGF